MKKQSLLTVLILVTSVLTGTAKAYGYTEVGQTVQLAVQPAVSVTKLSANETGVINVAKGSHEGMSASFLLQTNGTDDDYDFIIGSQVNISDVSTSGLTKNGNLIFVNMTSNPTAAAISDAQMEGSDNPNVIVYPLKVEITQPMTVEYGTNSTHGKCYVIKVNNESEGTIVETVGGTPLPGTYTLGLDEAGTYQATVYITTVSK